MKFKLVENINGGHENVSSNDILNEELGVRLYLGQNGSKIGGLFIETGKLLKQLWNEDSEYYDDINYYLSLLEEKMDVPELDYNNQNYNFAFKKSFINSEVREIIDDLNYYLNEIGYEVIEDSIDANNISYEDDVQFAYAINESNEFKQFFGSKLSHISNYGGNGDDICRALKTIFKEKFVIHHSNNKHTENNITNIYYLPERIHNRIFGMAVEAIEKNFRNTETYKELKNSMLIYSYIKRINMCINKLNTLLDKNSQLPLQKLPDKFNINGNYSESDIDEYRMSLIYSAQEDILNKLKNEHNNRIFTVEEAIRIVEEYNSN